MKTMKLATITVFLILAMAVAGFSQATPVITTLSAALAGGSTSNQMTVASTTGITASTSSAQTYCVVNHEVIQVRTVNSSTLLTVNRAVGGAAVPHASGAFLICGPAGGTFNPNTGNANGVFIGGTYQPSGACTAANNQYLPIVYTGGSGQAGWSLYNCNNATWQPQTFPDDVAPTITRFCAPNFLGSLTLLSSFGDSASPITMGTNTTPTAAQWYYGTIEVPKSMLITGGSLLNGTVGATDTLIYAIIRADGTKLANTTTAGTTASGIGRFQDIAFTSTYFATGPARYWFAVQASGNTTRIRTVSLTPGATTAGFGAWTGMLGSNFLGTTGTVPSNFASVSIAAGSVTALPTSLITGSAPVACFY